VWGSNPRNFTPDLPRVPVLTGCLYPQDGSGSWLSCAAYILICVQVPAGSLPRTMEVIFRNDIVEQARAGDKLVFSGSLVVVPDVSVITAPGQRSLLKGAGK